MTTKSKLALVATLATLIAGPAFANDQQASDEARSQVQTQAIVGSGAYASTERNIRAPRTAKPAAIQGDFQSTGSN